MFFYLIQEPISFSSSVQGKPRVPSTRSSAYNTNSAFRTYPLKETLEALREEAKVLMSLFSLSSIGAQSASAIHETTQILRSSVSDTGVQPVHRLIHTVSRHRKVSKEKRGAFCSESYYRAPVRNSVQSRHGARSRSRWRPSFKQFVLTMTFIR